MKLDLQEIIFRRGVRGCSPLTGARCGGLIPRDATRDVKADDQGLTGRRDVHHFEERSERA
jgi:hypothetical protein